MDDSAAVKLINASVRGLKAYHLEPEVTPLKLNQNENPYDWPPAVKAEIAAFCERRPWNRYPDFIPQELRESLGRHVGRSADSILVGNGSNEMLLVLLLACAHRERPVITMQPTFTVYSLLVNGLGLAEKRVFLTPDMQFDVPAIEDALERNPQSLCIICSPNNPTGGALDKEQLVSILDRHSGFCILDQAYVEFGGFNALELLDAYPNLIITRTFSKAFGGAGLRLGYLVAAPAVVAELNKIKLPYNINFFTDHVAKVLLQNAEVSRERVALLVRERQTLEAFLRTLPKLKVFPSSANFIMACVQGKNALLEELKRRGIRIRDVSAYPMLEECVRISVGTPEENRQLMDALSAWSAGS